MKRLAPRMIAVTTAALASALILVPTAAQIDAPQPSGWVHQAGTYDYLVQPDFAGVAALKDVVSNSTIGLGTFDALNGELVLVRGTVYRVGTDGEPREASLSSTTPFFQGVKFAPQASIQLAQDTTCSALIPVIDDLAQTTTGIVAVRINGTFATLTTRSVPKQSQPWPSLSEVIAEQVEFPLTDAKATLVGFRSGPDVLGIGQPGLHLHGLTRDETAGGHVLSCMVGAGARLQIQRVKGAQVQAASQD